MCGLVNAKNGFGGYGGYTRFLFPVSVENGPPGPFLDEGDEIVRKSFEDCLDWIWLRAKFTKVTRESDSMRNSEHGVS